MKKNHKMELRSSQKTRGEAMRTLRRNQDDADRIVSNYSSSSSKDIKQTTNLDSSDKLRITFLGGLEDVGEKNMAIIEYAGDAIVLDCGINLSVDLPGINYEINDTTYLDSIKHKLRAFVITHGHLDHIGGLRHIASKFDVPIYGSRYTTGIIEKSFDDENAEKNENFAPNLVTVNIDNHERIKIGEFFVEFMRVTHAIPDATAICIETPVGRIIATGDFRLDPEPLDHLSSDKTRLKELGDGGVLLLLSDSSYADAPGRVPTEHTLQESFTDIIARADGRIFVAVFSSNMNRTQMIINAAVAAGRKVALNGRSMIAYAEVAVRQGILKVPKGTIVTMQQTSTVPANQLLVMCTGGQGEPNAALQRMSEGTHKQVNLSRGDTVIISSSPIPGNEVSYGQISNRLSTKGVQLFRHTTHELDGCGPLHVSGHARRDELREMLQLTRPRFFIPVHAGTLRRRYHSEIGIEEGIKRVNVLLPENGDSLLFTNDSVTLGGQVPHGSLLVDQTSSIVSGVVVKDRLLLSSEGILTVVLTIDKLGRLLSSPDVVSRGFIAMKGNEELISALRVELKRITQQYFKHSDLDKFKFELRDNINHFLFEKTSRCPMVIPVVNVIGQRVEAGLAPNKSTKSPEAIVANEQARFARMRADLLNQDQRD